LGQETTYYLTFFVGGEGNPDKDSDRGFALLSAKVCVLLIVYDNFCRNNLRILICGNWSAVLSARVRGRRGSR